LTDKPSERLWLRHKRNGLTGYLTEKDGKPKVKLDGPDPFAMRPYHEPDWEPMPVETRIPRQMVAQVQWAADRALMRALGDHRAAGRDWHGLTTAQRVEFMDNGPGKRHGDSRKKVWEAIRDATKHLVEE